MKLDKRILLGGLCAMTALAIFAFKFTPEPASKEMSSPPKPVSRPVISASSTTQPTKEVVLTDHPAVDWKKEFQTSTNYFPLIAKAAKAGLEGDGRAAYYVSIKELDCLLFANQFGSAANPEEQFNEAMDSQKGQLPPEIIKKKREQLHACAGFYKVGDVKGNDVFAELPKREGGYRSNTYWMDLAYQNGDPLAKITHAGLLIGGPLAPNLAALPAAQEDINQAIASGDPEAIYRAGIIISDGRYAETFQGYALMLAACDLGYECTAQNSTKGNFPFGDCAAMGTCPAGSTVSDWVAENLGAEGYAKAYARAQQIKDALTQGDTSALQQFRKLKD
jgi:hypothetical protein